MSRSLESQPRRPGDRFFHYGLKLFFAAALASLLVVALGGLVQVRFLGAVGFTCAILGVGVCALGIRMVSPLRFRASIARFKWAVGLRDYPPYPGHGARLAVARSK